ncbi:TonB-dependent receptor [Fulvivirgaceae bacterium BMA12]|uniref:TonB-dependent receptor n=1 Tax=Agaribacillus aureus TaxID=3051825 RepID=A0ABT8LCZ9_9BACT|nr:TonB-dependent receptor [Fulvivirgaceae bacterium BMA12]
MMTKILKKILIMSKYTLIGFLLQTIFYPFLFAESTKGQRSLENIFVTIELKESNVKEVFTKIEKLTDFQFAYKKGEINKKQSISVKQQDISLANLLREIARATNLKFKRVNEIIHVTENGHLANAVFEIIVKDRVLNGRVTDENGEGLPGVNVLVKNTTIGTITDNKGDYTINVPDDATTLVFSYVGYISEEVDIVGRAVVDLQLAPDLSTLSEVVIIGYGTVKKSDLTGAVASVSEEEITQFPTIRVDEALQGRAPGLQITSTGSNLGANTTIRIRGSNSLNSDNEPLFVIDGFIGGGDLTTINTSDIESIEVLKDASATAIYGSRGSNGVIIITTKRGKKGRKPQFQYDSYLSMQKPIKKPLLPTGPEFAAISNETAEFLSPSSPVYDPAFDPNIVDINSLPTTDWWEELTRDGLLTSHTLSVSGGGESTRYYFSGNYFKQEGLYKDNELERFQFKANIDQEVNSRLKMGFSSQISRIYVDEIGVTPEFLGLNYSFNPTIPVFDNEGNYALNNLLGARDTDNPVAEQNQTINEQFRTRILGLAYAELELIKGLKYKLSAGVDIENRKRGRYNPNTLTEEPNNGTAEIRTSEDLSVLIENTLSYTREIGDDDRLDVVAGYTRQTRSSESFDARAFDFVTNLTGYDNLDGGAVQNRIRSEKSEDGLESWLFRSNYSLNDEFLFTLSARADAASQFAPNHKWAFFPSGAVAWRADKYLPLEIIQTAKLRVSYGEAGNIGIGRYSSLARVQQRAYILGTNQDLAIGFRQSTLVNPDLKWETTSQFNIGADLGFFDNRLNVTVDYYAKTTNDLIAGVPVPNSSGATSFLLNLGSMKNSGWELYIGSTNINNPNGFTWTTDFNIATNKNEVVEIAAEEGFVFVNGAFAFIGGNTSFSGIVQEGEPIGSFYGYVQDGLWNTQDEIDAFPGNSVDLKRLGGPRWADIDNDGDVDPDDRQIIGDPNPDFFGGITNTFSYKRFNLSAFLQYSVGGDILNFVPRNGNIIRGVPITDRSYRDRWTFQNMDSNIPRSGALTNDVNFEPSTAWIEDGSFLRLRTVTLGYDLPLEKIKYISSARVYFTASNLFTITNYTGFDPDVNTQGGSSNQGPFAANNVTRGYDNNRNPSIKNFTLGFNVQF